MKLNLTTYDVGFDKILLAPTRRPDRRHQSVRYLLCERRTVQRRTLRPERIQFDLQ